MICVDCMESPALKRFVLGRGAVDQCDYCQKEEIAVDDQVLLEHVERLFYSVLVHFDEIDKEFQCQFLGGADLSIGEIWNIFESQPATVADEFEEKLINHLVTEFVFECSGKNRPELFTINDGELSENQFSSGWKDFLRSIDHSHRFFNRSAESFLDELFHVLIDDFDLETKGVIAVIDDKQSIYRARVADSEETISAIKSDPGAQLGPTPPRLASDQRMSPVGISVFYGAYDRDTCISEIRPLVGDAAISGEFRPRKSLKLIDLNRLPDCRISRDIYDDDFVQHAHAATFFNQLVFEMSRPARRNVGNPYLSTQIIFEYMRVRFKDFADGILYRSVQQDQSGHCIALFPDSGSGGESPLQFVEGSLRYHRIHAVSYQQREYDDVGVMNMSEHSLAYFNLTKERDPHAH
jgi:hypothetical protein